MPVRRADQFEAPMDTQVRPRCEHSCDGSSPEQVPQIAGSASQSGPSTPRASARVALQDLLLDRE
jgi:hypothetical protein